MKVPCDVPIATTSPNSAFLRQCPCGVQGYKTMIAHHRELAIPREKGAPKIQSETSLSHPGIPSTVKAV